MILGRVVHRGVKLPNASSFTYQSDVKFSEISQLPGIQISGIQSLQRMEQLFLSATESEISRMVWS